MAMAEAHGSSVQNIIDGCGVFAPRVKQMLAERGITEVDANRWYDLEIVLDLMNDLSQRLGPNVLIEIGRYTPKNAQFPPEIDSFEKALNLLNTAYYLNHRNGDIGEYVVTRTDARTYKIFCNTPYPAKFNLGLLRGLARKFHVQARIEEIGSHSGGEFLVKW